MKINKKGFTLIELLVVIAIIGILATVVLTAVTQSRGKGQDAKIKSQLSGLRAAAEVYYDTNNNYGVAVADLCSDDFFVDVNSSMVQYTDTANYPLGTVLSCHSDTSAYAVSGSLFTATTSSWCVDSGGDSKEMVGTLADGQVDCP